VEEQKIAAVSGLLLVEPKKSTRLIIEMDLNGNTDHD
jgi:hypothetical protein